MKHLYKALLLSCGLVFAVGCNNAHDSQAATPGSMTAMAADSMHGRHHFPPPVSSLKTELGLSDDQVTKLKTLEDANRKTMQDLMQSSNGDREKMHAAFDANRQKMEAQVNAILTADQQAKLKDLRALRMGPGGPFGGPRMNPDSMLNRMKTELNLSDAQVNQIKALQEKMKPAPGATPGDRGPNGDHRNDFREQLKTILTPEQLAKLDSLHQARQAQWQKDHPDAKRNDHGFHGR